MRSFGAFKLPENMPDVIALDGEVFGRLLRGFRDAIIARPNAKVMLLNSPGGYVDSALAVAREVHDRGMSTMVAQDMGSLFGLLLHLLCRTAARRRGRTGVHQISAEVADLVLAQTTLCGRMDALNKFGVQQNVIVQMLRTPPEDMYVSLPRSDRVGRQPGWPNQDRGARRRHAAAAARYQPLHHPHRRPTRNEVAYVQLAPRATPRRARSVAHYAADRWAGALGDAAPEIVRRRPGAQGTVFRVRVPARSVENANAMCSAIKSAGGGCYVTKAAN